MSCKAIRRILLVLLVTIIACGAMMTSVSAWKTKTHGYSANLLLSEASDGYVTVDGINYKIPDEFKEALTKYPSAFRAGVLGPDFYPDMLTGQSYIHPYDTKSGTGVGDWLMLLVDQVNSLPRDSDVRREALAFTLGMAIHYAGDQFGHDFINAFAGGAYPAYADAMADENKLWYIIRHMAEESYMDSQIGDRLGNTGVAAPEKFILNTWIYNGTANAGAAEIYKKYGGMMYQYKYLVELRSKLYAFAEKNRPTIWPPVPQVVGYVDAWIKDLDTATYQLVVTFDDIAHDFLTGVKGKSDVEIVTSRLQTWLDKYGKYASPMPDWLTKISDALSKAKDTVLKEMGLGSIMDAWNAFKNNLIKEAVLWGLAQAGFDYEEYADYLSNPEKALKAKGGSEADWLEFKSYMDAFAADSESLDAFYNTLLMGKLILMGPDNLDTFFANHHAASAFSNGNAHLMMDEFILDTHTADVLYAGTDDNVFVDVYENGTLIHSQLLDISGYDDFERNKPGSYTVSLPHRISPDSFSIALRIEKATKIEADEDCWTVDKVWVTPRLAGVDVMKRKVLLNGQEFTMEGYYLILNKKYEFNTWGKRLYLSPGISSNDLTYSTALNPQIISYMWSNDNSSQWVNSRNSLWVNLAARRNILYEVFHGFKPTIELSASQTEFSEGTQATLTATFQSYWNGITKERRDREYIIPEVNETRQQACTGSVRICDSSGAQVLTGTISNGVANVNLSGLAVGTYTLTAYYDGDDYNGSSVSNSVTVKVTAPACKVTLSITPPGGGSVSGGGNYQKGATVKLSARPRTGYEFVSWTEDGKTVSESSTYSFTAEESRSLTANFRLKKFKITFVDEDGTLLKADTYDYGTPAKNIVTPETPTKPNDAQFTYTFAGWSPALQNVTREQTYKATYSDNTNSYTIQFVNYDGKVLQSSAVEYGQVPSYSGETPVQDATAQFTFTFNGWSPEVAEVTGSATYTAQYTSSVNSYTVRFVNEDGTELQSSDVEYGQLPSYSGETPAKGATAQYTYTFDGWTPAITKVTGKATYTAQYKSTVNQYSITFVDEDGTVLKAAAKYNYGTVSADLVKPADPTKPADAQYTYVFAGWSPALTDVKKDQTYKATYSDNVNSYKIRFVDEDGTELQSSSVPYGTLPSYSGETPAKEATAQYTYTFEEWSPSVTRVSEEATYTARYTSTVNSYLIRFVDENGTVLKETSYEYGTPADEIVKPSDPSKPATAQYTYTFAGWSPALTEVRGNQTYTATYSDNVNSYTVQFVNFDGAVLQSYAMEFGQTPSYTGDTPTRPADSEHRYVFDSWTPGFSRVTGNATYKAVYIAKELEKTVYAFIDSDDSWTKGSTVPLNATVKGSPSDETVFDSFLGLKVDGAEIPAECYEASRGSVKLKLKDTYLETLSVGTHTLTAVFGDGTAETAFTVLAAAASEPLEEPVTEPDTQEPIESPKTGAGSNLILWVVLALTAFLTVSGTILLSGQKPASRKGIR